MARLINDLGRVVGIKRMSACARLCRYRHNLAEQALRDRLSVIQSALPCAEEAVAAGEGNSRIWLSRKRTELARLRELLGLIDDPAIEPGAILRLNDAARYGIDRDASDVTKPLPEPGAGPDTLLRPPAP